MGNYHNHTPRSPDEHEDCVSGNSAGDSNEETVPVPTDYTKHLWLLYLIVLTVLFAAIVSWMKHM